MPSKNQSFEDALIAYGSVCFTNGDAYAYDTAYRAVIAAHMAVAVTRLPMRAKLWDSHWVNIVNHANCYADYSKEDAIHLAVKLTEQAMAKNTDGIQEGYALVPIDVDDLAQFIRNIDGQNSMGAGALAERICEWVTAHNKVGES